MATSTESQENDRRRLRRIRLSGKKEVRATSAIKVGVGVRVE